MLIDVHCHLDFYEKKEIEEIVERAKKADVEIIVCNGVNPVSNRRVLDLATKYPEIKAALGLYPIDALKMKDGRIDSELEFIGKNKDKIIAIGEVGMDFKESDDVEKQKTIFQKIIKLAIELDKPLIVHSRKAEGKVIEILEKNKMKKVVMHCFCGNFRLIARIVGNGWKMTVPTNAKSSEHFQQVIARVPIENLLCETDSPYLHPDKLQKNEPANVVISYQKIAEIKKLRLKEVEKKIETNFEELFSGSKIK